MESKYDFQIDEVFYTTNPLGEWVRCKYIRKTPNQQDCHEVQLMDGEYKGVCYKGADELHEEKPAK